NNETRYKTTLPAWFQENMNNTEAQNYKYIDFPVYYTWNAKLHKWNRRKNATEAIGRLYMICRTFKEAYTCLGLLQNDNEWNICLYKASNMQTEKQLRHLFVMILLMYQPLTPENLWNTHKLALCEDILYNA
ncbi:18912_t:CDS:2, partial [Funneliformis geosporum]